MQIDLSKIALNKSKIVNLWLVLLVTSLVFPIKYQFLSSNSNILGTYSDFTTFFLYLSDILIVSGLILALLGKDLTFSKFNKYFILLGIWLIFVIVAHFSNLGLFNDYFYLRILEGIVLYETVVALFKYINLNKTLHYLIIGGIFVTVLGILQFYMQHSLGLNIVGESPLSINTTNVAKIATTGLTFIRAYGTFPHANIFAAFLVAIINICVFLYIKSKSLKTEFAFAFTGSFLIVGLILTFSRAGWLALALSLLFLLILLAYKKLHVEKTIKLFALFAIVAIVSLIILRPLVSKRAEIFDQAATERRLYNTIAVNIIKNNPVFGLGAGESVIHMEQYSPKVLQPLQKQPIHNYFLISAAELGIPGAIILVAFLIYVLRKLFLAIKNSLVGESNDQLLFQITTLSILLSFLVLMFFDHYFYTLVPSQLLLWLLMGLSVGSVGLSEQIKNPS